MLRLYAVHLDTLGSSPLHELFDRFHTYLRRLGLTQTDQPHCSTLWSKYQLPWSSGLLTPARIESSVQWRPMADIGDVNSIYVNPAMVLINLVDGVKTCYGVR